MTTDAPRFIVRVIDRMDDSEDYTVNDPDVSTMPGTFGSLTILRIQDIVTNSVSIYFVEPGMKIHVIPIKVN